MLGQVVDGVPDVPELAELAVDVGDRGLRGDDGLETLFRGHGRFLTWAAVGTEREFTKEEVFGSAPCRTGRPVDIGFATELACRTSMAVDEVLRRKREEVCLGHMTAENAHDFDVAIGF